MKYFVREEASLKGNGYFLWAFSTLEQNTKTEGRYHAYKLNIQRSENSVGGWTRETLMDVGKPSIKGKWQYAVYTQDGADGRLYINGDAFLAGTLIEDVRVYMSALSAKDVQKLTKKLLK